MQQLVVDVDAAVGAAGYLGGGIVTERAMSITWTFPSTDVPAAARPRGPARCPTGSTPATGSPPSTTTPRAACSGPEDVDLSERSQLSPKG